MLTVTHHHTFIAFTLTSLVLCLNLLFLWVYSGVVRHREKVANNPEDGKAYSVPVSDTNPPETARILRAHANAQATIYPFLFLAFIYTLSGGSALVADITFGIFSVARWSYSYCYIAAKQPYRSLSFAIGMVMQAALIIEIIIQMLK